MSGPAVIARKFQIDRLVGEGGMGKVYLARDLRLGNRRVALKLLRVDNEDARRRFEREAASAANLHHRNIVVIYEYGDHEGQPYIAMEFIEGDPLSRIIEDRRPLSIGRKLELLDDLAQGLGSAHKQGIVHRDIKPGNLLLNSDGCLKIVDFGIVGVRTATEESLRSFVGTRNYMSPEQVNGEVVDRRSDIFAVGLVAYELFSYRMAFPGGSPGRVFDAIRYRDPEPLESFVTNCDPRLAGLVRRAVAKRPSDRYQQLEDLRVDLDAIRKTTGPDDQKPLSDRIETVVQRRPTTPQPAALDRAALARRRQRIVEEHLEAGNVALDAGDLDTAVDRFEQAAALDDLNPQALELLERARARQTDRQVDKLLDHADARLADSQLAEASELVEQALDLRSESSRAAAVHQRIVAARAVESAVELARQHLANNSADAALRAASEALSYDPSNTEALELTRRALESITETQRQKRHRLQVQEALLSARELLSAGKADAAVVALAPFDAHDEFVAPLLAQANAQLEESRRRAASIAPVAPLVVASAAVEPLQPVEPPAPGTANIATPDERPRKQIDTPCVVEEKPPPAPVVVQVAAAQPKQDVLPAAPRPRTPERTRSTKLLVLSGAGVLAAVIVAYFMIPSGKTQPVAPTRDTSSGGGAPAVEQPSGGAGTGIADAVRGSGVPGGATTVTGSPTGAEIAKPGGGVGAVAAPLSPRVEPEPDARTMALAKSATDQRRYADAIDIYSNILKTAPANAAVMAALANARQARARQVQSVNELIAKGDAFQREKDYAKAIESFQAALAEDPASQPAADKRDAAKAVQKKADDAARGILGGTKAEDVVGGIPGGARPVRPADDSAALLKQANALLDTGLIDDAIATFNDVLKTHPDNAEAIAGRDKAVARKGQGRFN